nr:MAG TPA: hypothetical protein [Microviridae sp.]
MHIISNIFASIVSFAIATAVLYVHFDNNGNVTIFPLSFLLVIIVQFVAAIIFKFLCSMWNG